MATIFKKYTDLLEKVQRRATRLMTSDESLSYSDRLQKFGLTTLETGSSIYCIGLISTSAYGSTSYETPQGTSWIPTKHTNVSFYII